MELMATTRLACEIAKIDSLHLNVWVNSGAYPCAPATTRGVPRTYHVDDIVSLVIFGISMREDIAPAQAGYIACEIRDVMRQNPGEAVVTRIVGSGGDVFFAGQDDPQGKSLGRPLWATTFFVDEIRKDVRIRLEQEHRIVGGR